MSKRLATLRFVPVRETTSSDCRVGLESSTAETDNLAAVMRNNTIYTDPPITVVDARAELPSREDEPVTPAA